MELYGTKTSPFTRIVRIIAVELGFEMPLIEKAWRRDSHDIYRLNPAGRIPILVDGDRGVSDSRTICNYLMEHEKAQPAQSFRVLRGKKEWDEENALCMIYGFLESVAMLSYFRDPPQVAHPYIDRNRERIDECFEGLDTISAMGFLVEPDSFGMAEAALITSMDIIEGRKFADLGAYENVREIRSLFRHRPSLTDTRPDFAGRDK